MANLKKFNVGDKVKLKPEHEVYYKWGICVVGGYYHDPNYLNYKYNDLSLYRIGVIKSNGKEDGHQAIYFELVESKNKLPSWF